MDMIEARGLPSRLARHIDRLRTLTVVSTPHPMAHARALRSDGEQTRMSAYFALFWQEGEAEDVLLADDARRLRSLFGGSAVRTWR